MNKASERALFSYKNTACTGEPTTELGARLKDAYADAQKFSEDINYFTHLPIQFEIQMPADTKGLITDNWQESEFIAKPGSTLDILGAEAYTDGEKDCVRIWSRLTQD